MVYFANRFGAHCRRVGGSVAMPSGPCSSRVNLIVVVAGSSPSKIVQKQTSECARAVGGDVKTKKITKTSNMGTWNKFEPKDKARWRGHLRSGVLNKQLYSYTQNQLAGQSALTLINTRDWRSLSRLALLLPLRRTLVVRADGTGR